MARERVLVVDDEEGVRNSLRSILKDEDYSVDLAESGERCLDMVRRRPGTQRAYARGEPYSNRPTVTEEGKKILFGQTSARASVA